MSNRKAPPVRHDDPGMTGQRARDLTGELRQKRGDTLVRTIEEMYGVDLHRRGDMKLETLREELGVTGIKDLIESGMNE
jgi:hypothetical protein